MNHRIETASPQADGLKITVNGETRQFSWRWLRDHSQDPASYHQQTRQRILGIEATAETSAPDELEVTPDGVAIRLFWAGADHNARYSADYLATVDAPERLYRTRNLAPVLWDAGSAQAALRSFSYRPVIGSDAVLGELLQAVVATGMALVTSVPKDIAATREVMERLGYIRTTIFGDMWHVRSDGEFDDTGSTQLEIEPHTDGTYSHDAPGVMTLHCLSSAVEGGENILVDGFGVASRLRDSNPQQYRMLTEFAIPGQYIGDGVYLVAQRPVISTDSEGWVRQISYNNHDRAPFHLPEPRMSHLYAALTEFGRLIADRSNQFLLKLEPGEMIVFDNWRLLHGRLAFEGNRHITGCYINREDFESRLRVLAPQPLNMVG